ncbi:hypothetical protein ACLKA6_001567 [Drosophila palustris]
MACAAPGEQAYNHDCYVPLDSPCELIVSARSPVRGLGPCLKMACAAPGEQAHNHDCYIPLGSPFELIVSARLPVRGLGALP